MLPHPRTQQPTPDSKKQGSDSAHSAREASAGGLVLRSDAEATLYVPIPAGPCEGPYKLRFLEVKGQDQSAKDPSCPWSKSFSGSQQGQEKPKLSKAPRVLVLPHSSISVLPRTPHPNAVVRASSHLRHGPHLWSGEALGLKCPAHSACLSSCAAETAINPMSAHNGGHSRGPETTLENSKQWPK
ncbi:hypothetical protein P7K49_006054 [Saguinus oedipus]|uniref:Uncharacterized protein n=1 Tax=Saguinus oedipus TaxID=9490 RepID=A0ABQ9W1A6_SAGOE|nr:hypothetical protein P7K49_006054 [Saguinus oedipus]